MNYQTIIDEVSELNDLQMFEIYKIIKNNVPKKEYTINTNGIYIELNNMSKKCLNEIVNFIKFTKEKNKEILETEKERNSLIIEMNNYIDNKKKNKKKPIIKKKKKDIQLKGTLINLNKKKKNIKGEINLKIIKNLKNNKNNKINTTENIKNKNNSLNSDYDSDEIILENSDSDSDY